MPSRRRRRPGGSAEVPSPAAEGGRQGEADAARLFAERQERLKAEERELARAHREASEREQRRRDLLRAKEDAAARLKDVRRRGGSADERAAADAAYRAALDAVLRDEQGLPPADDDAPEADAPEP